MATSLSAPPKERPRRTEAQATTTGSSWWMREAMLLRAVLLLTLACYLPSMWFDFVYDDHYLLAVNPWLESWRQVPAIFTHSFWGFLEIPRVTDYYRPLVMLLLAAVRHLLGPAPGWSHLVVAGVHLLATYLVYLLGRELLNDGVTAAVAAGLFGLHPTKVETAAWISGVSDSLCLVFFLGALIGYLKWKRAGKRGAWLPASLVLLLLALFSKEAAVLAPVLIGIYELSTAEGSVRSRLSTVMRCVTPYVLVVGVFWVIRIFALRGFVGASQYELQLGPTIWTGPRAVLWYLGKQFWPGALSVQYPLVLVRHFSVTAFLLPLVVLVAAAIVLLRVVWGRPAGLFLAAWFLLTLAPVILFAVPLQVHDRYSYLPSVASSIALAYALVNFRRESLGAPRVLVVYLLLLAMAAGTVNYARYWDNDLKLFEHAVQVAPDNPDAYNGLVLAHTLISDTAGAEQVARLWVQRMPERWVSWYALAMAQADQKDFQDARVSLENSLRHAETGKAAVVPLLGLGYVDQALHDDAPAELCYRQAVALAPNVAALHRYLANALEREGKVDEAQREFAIAKRLQ